MDKNTILIHDTCVESLEDAIENSLFDAKFDSESYELTIGNEIFNLRQCQTIGVDSDFDLYRFEFSRYLKDKLKKVESEEELIEREFIEPVTDHMFKLIEEELKKDT